MGTHIRLPVYVHPAGAVFSGASSALRSSMQLAYQPFCPGDMGLYTWIFLWLGRLRGYGLEGLPGYYEKADKEEKDQRPGV